MCNNNLDSKQTTFHLGIVLAGGVTAGAYSAGVLYYLFENLKNWHAQKERNNCVWQKYNGNLALDVHKEYDPSVPMHDVIVEVLGGSSAGSLVAAIAAMSLGYDQQKIDPDDSEKLYQNNLLFDSWVNMLDNTSGRDTLTEFLKNPTIPPEHFSLLNRDAIDTLKKEQLAAYRKLNKNPRECQKYISCNLEVLFTLTSLKGIPVGIRFSQSRPGQSTVAPAHFMSVHRLIAHYAVRKQKESMLLDPGLGPKQDPEPFIDMALASGAFPVGLPPREIKLSKEYVRHMVQSMFPTVQPHNLDIRGLTGTEDWRTDAVDGGTLNNEPFTEVNRIVACRVKKDKDKVKDKEEDKDKEPDTHHAIIMIDPFPNFYHTGELKEPDLTNPRELLLTFLSTIRGQAMIKEGDALQGFTDNPHIGMIFPSRRDADFKPLTPALASESIAGFAGFIHRGFRLHDFILGMRNCQSFIRWFFNIPQECVSENRYKSYLDWQSTDARYQRFHVGRAKPVSHTDCGEENTNPVTPCEEKTREVKYDIYFPIIPDMGISANSNVRDSPGITPKEFPQIKASHLYRYGPLLRRRLRKILFAQFSTRRKTSLPTLPEDSLVHKISRPFRFLDGFLRYLILFLVLAIAGLAYACMHQWAFWSILVLIPLLGFVLLWWVVPGMLKNRIMRYVTETLAESGQIVDDNVNINNNRQSNHIDDSNKSNLA